MFLQKLFLVSFDDPMTKLSNFSIYIEEKFLKSHTFQETTASSKISISKYLCCYNVEKTKNCITIRKNARG